MALLEILTFPDPRLRTRAQPVVEVDETIHRLVDDMLETMYAAQGIGLAATQVNVHQRVIVLDVSAEQNEPLLLINPEITVLPGDQRDFEEGCLSVPGHYGAVRRPENIMLCALDRNGQTFERPAAGLLAVCIQHEIDHLNGKLFVDYLSPLKRRRIGEKLKGQSLSPPELEKMRQDRRKRYAEQNEPASL